MRKQTQIKEISFTSVADQNQCIPQSNNVLKTRSQRNTIVRMRIIMLAIIRALMTMMKTITVTFNIALIDIVKAQIQH